MKPALFFTLLFLFLAFTTNLPLALSQGVEQVLDTNGNPIFPAGRYFILPAIFGAAGGGVRLGETDNSTCPVTVLQDYSEVVRGDAVKFTIPGISPGIIFTGTQLDIAFEENPECATSTKWVVVVDDFPGEWVGIGGAGNHPGKQIITGRYDDEKGRRLILTNGDPYQVVFVDADATGRSTH
ncbi:Kunitz-type trypsin inhibitor-like 2 protein, partial [Mucuna pruriens]